jgi:DNA polymerase IV (DinB-like DNA polymerase)
MERVIIHVDLDAFYATVEEREDPSIKGKAVVVCMFSSRGGDSGAVAAANYEARRSGIHSGMSIKRAKKLDPDGVFLPARRDFYSTVSKKIMDILKRHADAFEQMSIDEAFLDVSERTNYDFERAGKIAELLKKEVKVKEGLTCSIGIGPNKIISKMAASVEKPDGFTVINPSEVEGFLDPLDVDRLWGVGNKTKASLEEIGVRTIGELAQTGRQRLIEMFGKAKGQWLSLASRGIDEEPVLERGDQEQIGRITTLEEDTRDIEKIQAKVNELAREVHETVIEKGLVYRTVTFFAVTKDMKGHTKSRTLSTPSDELKLIQETGLELIRDFLADSELRIRRAGIRVSNLSKPTKQRTLLQY